MKILVVDDSRAIRMIVKRTLRQAGFGDHEVEVAEDGKEALTMIQNSAYGLVLTDWNMPNMTGTELAKALRDRGEQVPILMVTARSVREDIIEAMEAGVNNYIVKPFTPQILKE